MKITLITVGKIKEKYFRDAIEEYAKRLSKYCKLDVIEVADEKTPDKISFAQDAVVYTRPSLRDTMDSVSIAKQI